MKGIRAYYICKGKGLINHKMSYRNFKFMKEIFGHDRWDHYIIHLMQLKYYDWLFNNAQLDIIRVPEVKFQIGGTVTVNIGKLDQKNYDPDNAISVTDTEWS